MAGIWLDSGEAPAWEAGAHKDVGDLVGGGGAVWIVTTPGDTGLIEPTWSFPTPVTGDGDVDYDPLQVWQATTEYHIGDVVQPTTPNAHFYTAQNHFTSDSAEPDPWATDGGSFGDGTVIEDGGGYGPEAAEVRMYFDVWAPDDLYGDAIGTLEKIWEMRIRSVDNSIGDGAFSVNRHDDDFGLAQTDSLIRVRLDPDGPFAYNDPRYKFAFFIEDGRDTVLSEEEGGAEVAKLHGREAVVILARAIIDWEAHHPFNDAAPRAFDRTVREDGQWHINASEFDSASIGTPGSVLRIFLRDASAQTPNPLPELSVYPTGHDFNVNHDSLGVTWSDGATDWSFDVGTDLLSVLGILVNSKLYFKMTPALVLHAYENRQGRDLSGSITVAEAVDIVTSADVDIMASAAKSRMLVRGANAGGKFTYRWTNESDGSAHHDSLTPGSIESSAIGVRQGYMEYGASPTPSRLDRAGSLQVTRLANQHAGVPLLGVLNRAGAVALVDYEAGDTISVDLESFGPTRVFAIQLIARDSTSSVDPVLEFVDDVSDFNSPVAAVKGGCCGCSDGAVVNQDDDPELWVYQGQPNGPHLVGAGTGSGEGYAVTAGAFIPGTLAVFSSTGHFIVPASQSPDDGTFVATAPSGDVYASWRSPCEDPDPCC